MTVRSVFRKLRTQWLGLAAGRPRRRPSRSVVLGFESLETRLVPAVDVWTGFGSPDMTHGGALDWTDTANWATGIPNPGDDLVFPSGVSAALTSTFNDFAAGTTFNSITIQGSDYTLAGNQVNLMATAGNPGGGGYVFASNFTTNNVISLDLQLGGTAGQRQSMTVNAGADLTLSGHLIGPGGVELDKAGTGTLVFSNNDSGFTGPVMVAQGIVRIEDPSALGSGGAATTVQTGAQLQVSNANGGISQTLVLNGTGISNGGALLALAGNASLGGAVILGTDSTIGVVSGPTASITAASEVGTTVTITTATPHGFQVGENVTIAGITPFGYDGTVTITGVLDPTQFTYTAAAGLGPATTAGATATPVGATLNITGQVSDLGAGHSLTKEGFGELILSGANTYRGQTIVNNGLLTIQNALALGTAGSTQNGTIVNSTATEKGTLQLKDPAGLGFNVLGENLTLNGTGATVNGVAVGALNGLDGNNTWAGPITLTGNTSIGAVAGSDVLLNIAGTISDSVTGANFRLTKVGLGDDEFSGPNTYGGPTDVQQGRLLVANPQALGGTTNGTTVEAGAELALQADINGEPLFLNGNGVAGAGALDSLTSVNNYTGPITLQSDSTIGAEAGSQLTIRNTIGDGGNGFNLTKAGLGTLTLAHSTTYGGTTLVNAGTLQLSDPQALAASAGTQVTSGASLQLVGSITISGQQLTLAGMGVSNGGALLGAGGSSTWDGAITLDGQTALGAGAGSTLTVTGVMSDGTPAGSVTKVGQGTVVLNAPNTYTGTTAVNAGTLTLEDPGAVGGSSTTAVNNTATLLLANGVTISGEPLTLTGSGVLSQGALQDAGSDATWAGPVTLVGSATVGAAVGTNLTISGPIGGAAGSLAMVGPGTVTLSAPNTYGGGTTIGAGTLVVDGSIGDVAVQGGVLTGSGTVGAITTAPLATVEPGDSGGLTLTSNGNGRLIFASTFLAQINGTNQGTDYSFLNVTGTFDLAQATLSAVFGNSFVPDIGGATFTILHASGGVSHEFAQGATAVLGGLNFAITYGPNDVTLQRIGAGTTTTIVEPTTAAQLATQSTLTATVVPANGATGTPTGSVDFMDNPVPSPNNPTPAPVDLGSAPLQLVNGVPTATLSSTTAASLHAGFHNITAIYSGDSDFATSNSASVEVGGLAVTGLTPTGPVAQTPGLSSINITFNTGVPQGNFPSRAVVLEAPSGQAIPLTDAGGNFLPGVNLLDTNPGLPTDPTANTVWQLNFPAQTAAGVYTLSVGVGPNNVAGQDVTDTTGTKMDQNQDHSPGEFGPAPQGDEFVGFLTVGGLNVVSVTPTTVVDDNGLSSMLLTFNAAVSSFPTSAVALAGPSAITVANESGTTVTITTATPHGYQVGANVTIAGITPSGYDGTFVITGVPDATHFTYTAATGLGPATLGSNATATGPIPLTASQNPSVSLITLTDKNPGLDTLWQLTVPTQTTPGVYTLTIGPNVIDRAGNPMPAAFQQQLTVQGLTVLSVQPAGLPTSLSSITLTFNEVAQLDQALGAGNVSVLDPSGNPIQGLSVSDLTLGTSNPTHNVWQVTLANPAGAPGTYTLKLGAGVLDGAGRTLGTAFTAKFQIVSLTTSSSQPPPTTTGTTPLNGQIVTNGITFLPGPVTAVRGTRRGSFEEALTFFNFGPLQLQGLFSLVLAGLPTAGRKGHAGVKVLNRAGTSHSVVPGSPYVVTFLSNAQALSFQGATVILHFRASRKSDITFTPILVVGTP